MRPVYFLTVSFSFGMVCAMNTSSSVSFSICNEIFKGWSMEDTLAFAAKTGYRAVEIAPFTLAERVTEIPHEQRQRIKETAARLNIQISGIHWVLVKPEGLYINHPDESRRTKTAQYFCDLVDFCADIGGRFMIVGSPKQRSIIEGISPEQASEWALDTLRPAVEKAAQRQVTICVEPLSPAETNFLNTAEQAIAFVQKMRHPHFKIMLDVKAMCSESKPIPQIIKESWPNFAYFHANDRNLKGPGFGDVDFIPIASALREVGYRGFVSVEVFNFEEGPEVIARKSLEYLQRAFGKNA
jgi:sugar phosphate isomerase/epimerase